jgi:ribosomal protein L15
MKKVLLIAVTIVAVIALGNVLLASAQGGTQPTQPNAACPLGYTCPMSGTMPFGMMGRGMMGGRGMHGMMGGYGTYTGTMPMHGAMMGPNGMHEQVWTAIAAELDMTYAELNTAVQNGQTVAQLAEAKGVSLDELKTAAKNAHQAALADLVEQGVLTQEQADWMLDHLDDMPMFNFEQGFGPGMMNGRGMMRGNGMMRGYQQPTGPQG